MTRKINATVVISPNAFTLIELLITVAIIAILAAIAVPNFLEAQTRSKVARAKADLRTLSLVIETYSVDFGRPPFDGNPGSAHYGWVEAFKQLTTPVAYITTIPTDVFQDGQAPETLRLGHTNFLGNRHSYDYATRFWEDVDNGGSQAANWERNMRNSTYKLTSSGPDTDFINDGSFFGFRDLYDPTNGTVSLGDIVRSQANINSTL
ncbi:MAG: type II secretion system protein [Sumerlaeia bacterium]